MAGTSSSRHQALWAALLFSLLLGLGGGAAFDSTSVQGCDKKGNNVTQLWLNGTGLSGAVPPEIGKCTALQVLSLSNNPRVNGSIPREIGQLTNLIILDLGNTNLTGPIPEEIGNLGSLQTLNLAGSSVGGLIPWDALCARTNLSLLFLNYTKVEGPITRGIGKCTALKALSLTGSSNVNGSIPSEIGQLTNLVKLSLGGTSLSGPIPPEIGNCSALQGVSLDKCSKVSGSIPAEIGQLAKLTQLYLGNTSLTGRIPEELSRLSNLGVLDLRHNNLTGPVPWEALCQLSNISDLNLGSNPQLKAGPFSPRCLWNLTSLQNLDLSNSPVFGGYPLSLDLCQLVKLRWLSVGSTNLSGTIPACLGNVSGLQVLDLSGNALVGKLPSELGSLRNLALLSLGSNNLTGNIPAEFGGLGQLLLLDASNNNLSGTLPARAFAGLRQLKFLDLSNNSLTGPIPTEIGTSGEALLFLKVANNSLSAAIPPGLGNLSNLNYLDMSYNQLSGPLPVELKGLHPSELGSINLRYNNLTGGVDPIGHLTGLTGIALDNNKFSGPIPTTWFGSTKLAYLSLSFNNFSGPIPSAIRNMRPSNDLIDFVASLSLSDPIQASLAEEAAGSIFIGLNSNQLSGSFPDIGALNISAVMNFSENKLSGTFRAGPFIKRKVSASILELGNNGPLELVRGYNLSGLELVTLPNISSGGEPLIAPDTRALTIAARGVPPSESLDLARVPATCPYVSYAQDGTVNDINFWDACDTSFGCVVNLIGTGAKLSRATRERVCLGKISVFLEGDSPSLRFPVGGPGSFYLVNQQGSVYFNDSAFINKLNLGPGGVAYTGVNFPRVQQGNLCRNKAAAEVVGIIYGAFAALILASAVGWWCAKACGVFGKTCSTGGKLPPKIARVIGAGGYLWGVVAFFLSWADLVSDILVVVEIWGVWSAWVILGLVLVPFAVSALYAGRVLLEGSDRWFKPSETRFKWIPFYNLPDPTDPLPLGAFPLWKYPFIPLALPATVGYVIMLDALDVIDKIGAHLRFGTTVYTLHVYSNFRSQVDLTLRSIPQAVFQTALYLLGSSRATRIYIDEQILLRSILLSLLNVLLQFNFLVHENLTTRVPVWTILQRRFAARNCRATPLSAAADDDEKVDEEGFEILGEL